MFSAAVEPLPTENRLFPAYGGTAKLICVLIGDNELAEGAPDDAEIEPERPVLDVPDVALDASLHLPQLLCLAAVAGDLCPAGDAGAHEMAHHVLVDEARVLLGMGEHVGTGADDGHVAAQDVPELGQLVDIHAAHEIAEGKLAGVVLRGLQAVGIDIDVHGAELQALEALAADARALLAEEDGTRTLKLDNQGDDGREGQQQEQHEEGEDDIEEPLDELVGGQLQRVDIVGVADGLANLLDLQAVAEGLGTHGNEIEMDDVAVAEAHDALDGVALRPGEGAVELVGDNGGCCRSRAATYREREGRGGSGGGSRSRAATCGEREGRGGSGGGCRSRAATCGEREERGGGRGGGDGLKVGEGAEMRGERGLSPLSTNLIPRMVGIVADDAVAGGGVGDEEVVDGKERRIAAHEKHRAAVTTEAAVVLDGPSLGEAGD